MLRIIIIISFILFICWFDSLSAHPADEPTKFILNNIQNNTENISPSKLEEAKESLGRVFDAIRIGTGRFINSIILARNIIINRAEQLNSKTNEAQNNLDPVVVIKFDKSNQSRRSVQSTTPIVLFHQSPRESVRLENETEQAILERRKPDNIRQILNNIVTPTPIVDGIKEEEKYGNTGDKFIGLGNMIVKGFVNLTNSLSTIVNIPYNAAKQTSRAVSQILDQLGKRLIGLE
ncbi:uncharacterized protein LOC112639484 isoform X1 [Camponotus floridanus]|uniref:uncharacterized protein LOC112639484 isoform X1 n=1 Tax=Camponotus floridanus TaxID=104421 RepID=UPI000DC695BA|nr:uncharacterized protein LOC112639484 isoform X1 [Camponotus floridanus]